MNKLETSERNVHKLIKGLRAAGFSIPRPIAGYYSLTSLPKGMSSVGNMLYFTQEEADILGRAIYSIHPNHALKESLLRRLHCFMKKTLAPETLADNFMGHIIKELQRGINERKQVCLLQYRSSSSNKMSDRLVEVFFMDDACTRITAYDLNDEKCKSFMTSRCGNVQVLDRPFQYARHHKHLKTDAFRFSGDIAYTIQLQLDTLARNLLTEEYPVTRSKILKQNEDTFIYQDQVYDLKGVGRFVLGLYKHIHILEGDELKEYVLKSLTEYREKAIEMMEAKRIT